MFPLALHRTLNSLGWLVMSGWRWGGGGGGGGEEEEEEEEAEEEEEGFVAGLQTQFGAGAYRS